MKIVIYIMQNKRYTNYNITNTQETHNTQYVHYV